MMKESSSKLTYTALATLFSMTTAFQVTDVLANQSTLTIEERMVSQEEARPEKVDFVLSDWAYEENAKYIIITGARNDKDKIYIPGVYNGKRVILEDLKLFPKTMTHLMIESVDGTKVGLQAPNISESFADWEGLGLDLRGLDTSKVENMNRLFSGSQELQYLDLSGWDTSNVTDMGGMFSSLSKLQDLDLSSFTTGNVTNMSEMFAGLKLGSLDLSMFDTSNVTTMRGMFSGSTNLNSLNISSFNTSKVENMENMFSGLESLRSLDLSHFDTNHAENMNNMFSGMKTLATLNVKSFDTSNVTTMSAMFDGLEMIEKLELRNFNTDKVEDMSSMFAGTKSLKVLDISGFNTSEVRNMSGMFRECGLSELVLSHFNTINVRDMSGMFSGMENIVTLDLSNFDTLNVSSIGGMFTGTKNLTQLDLSNFDLKWVNNDQLERLFELSDYKARVLVVFAKDSKLQKYDFENDNRLGSVLSYESPTISSTTISGKAKPRTSIELRSGDGSLIDEVFVGSTGAYSFNIGKQPLGTTFILDITTPEYGTSQKKLIVQDEFTTFSLTNLPLPTTTSLYGTGAPGALVEVYTIEGEVLDRTTVNSKGNFKLNIPNQEVNTVLTFKMSKEGYVTKIHKVAVYNELTIFEIPQISIKTTVVSGKAVPEAKVGVYTTTGTRLALVNVDAKGNYKLTIPTQKAGTTLVFKQAKSGYGTLTKEVSVLDEFKNLTIFDTTNSSSAIYGTGEPGANVRAYVNGKAISELTPVNSKGNYKIIIPKQKAGTVVEVKMAKKGFTTTSKKATILTALKTFTYNTPSISSTTISGKGVVGAKVGVYNSKGTRLALGTVDAKGNYKLTIPKQKAGTKLVIKQAKSGYATLSKEVTVLNEIKTFTHTTPSISSTTITGKGLVGSKVGVYTTNGTRLALVNVDSKGNYKLTIPKQKAGTKLVIKQAKTGYLTASKNITVLNEIKTFTHTAVRSSSTTVSGKALVGSKVGIYTSTGKRLALVNTDSKGNYKLTIPKQKVGTKLVIKQAKTGYVTASKNITVVK